MDLRMPVMDGVEAARQIRALDGGREVKIAAVTASVFAGQRSEVLAAGLDDFVRKPYRPSDIFDCMARHLGVRYRYLEAWPASRAEPGAALPPEALAALPGELRAELRDAVIALRSSSALRRSSAACGSGIPPSAAALARCADRLAYTAIFQALEGGQAKSTGESLHS